VVHATAVRRRPCRSSVRRRMCSFRGLPSRGEFAIGNPGGTHSRRRILRPNRIRQCSAILRQSSSAPLTNTSAQSNSGPATLIAVRSGASAETAHNTQPSSNPANTGARATTSAAEQPKKPVLGEVHLAKPKVSASRRAQNGGEPDAGIAFNNDAQPSPARKRSTPDSPAATNSLRHPQRRFPLAGTSDRQN